MNIKKLEEQHKPILDFLNAWQNDDLYHINDLNSLYSMEFTDELEKFDLLESYYDYDLSLYFKDEFIAFADDGAGGYFCFWIYPKLEGNPPIVYNDGHGESELLAASLQDLVSRMIYDVNFEGDKELDKDIFWDLVESYDDVNNKDTSEDEATLLIEKDRELFKERVNNITTILTEETVKNNLTNVPDYTKRDSQFTVKNLELYILGGREINDDKDLDKVLKHFEAELTNGVELYKKEELLNGFKANYPQYWKLKKVQNWVKFIENLTEKDKKILFLTRIETYIEKLKDNNSEEAKLVRIRYEKLYENLKKEIDVYEK